jgi:hypothetical protein
MLLRCRRRGDAVGINDNGATKMKSVLFAAAAMLALSPVSSVIAQTQLPATNVTAPKPKPRPMVNVPTAPSRSTTNSASIVPDRPDPETPHVRARDWNAPGVMNLNYMTEAQFVAFQAMHPTAVFYGRCFAGQDPDLNIRATFRRHPPFGCWG